MSKHTLAPQISEEVDGVVHVHIKNDNNYSSTSSSSSSPPNACSIHNDNNPNCHNINDNNNNDNDDVFHESHQVKPARANKPIIHNDGYATFPKTNKSVKFEFPLIENKIITSEKHKGSENNLERQRKSTEGNEKKICKEKEKPQFLEKMKSQEGQRKPQLMEENVEKMRSQEVRRKPEILKKKDEKTLNQKEGNSQIVEHVVSKIINDTKKYSTIDPTVMMTPVKDFPQLMTLSSSTSSSATDIPSSDMIENPKKHETIVKFSDQRRNKRKPVYENLYELVGENDENDYGSSDYKIGDGGMNFDYRERIQSPRRNSESIRQSPPESFYGLGSYYGRSNPSLSPPLMCQSPPPPPCSPYHHPLYPVSYMPPPYMYPPYGPYSYQYPYPHPSYPPYGSFPNIQSACDHRNHHHHHHDRGGGKLPSDTKSEHDLLDLTNDCLMTTTQSEYDLLDLSKDYHHQSAGELPPPVNFSTYPKTAKSAENLWTGIFEAIPALSITQMEGQIRKNDEKKVVENNNDAKSSVSDRKKFFEKAMEEHHQPSPKPERVFTFLSQDEIEKLKQEEERKIASLSKNVVRSWSELDEEETDNSPSNRTYNISQNISTPPPPPPQHTLNSTYIISQDDNGISKTDDVKELSPAEQRTLKAEQRAAWRQARLKSLEQDALQAQLVIKKMIEISDGKNKEGNNDDDEDDDEEEEIKSKIENTQLEVETTKEKIVQLEMTPANLDIPILSQENKLS